MAVLISFPLWKPWLGRYLRSFDRVLVDSGAFSEFNTGVSIDPAKYKEWAEQIPWADAVAALDDISGDTKKTLRNAEDFGFPTYHDTDPAESLPDFLELAQRDGWIGLGMKPPRTGREPWLQRTLHAVPENLHIHVWAGAAYSHLSRIDSVDSTHWWREAMKVRKALPWLTEGECLEILAKKIQRFARQVPGKLQQQETMFDA